MQQIELITGLPSRLSCIILQDWLNLKSVMALDSAFSCHAYRDTFLDLLRSDEYFISEKIVITRRGVILKVLHKLGQKLRHVEFAARLLPTHKELIILHCQNLTHVHFRRQGSCPDELQTILSSKVVRLDISGGHIGYPIFLSPIPRLCPQLTSLGLANSKIDGTFLKTITSSCSHIVHLDIAINYKLVDADILHVVQNLKGLQSLNIEGVIQLTDASLVHIYTHCAATLHTLFLDCGKSPYIEEAEIIAPNFGRHAINVLLERCTQLHTLYLGRLVPYMNGAFDILPTAFKNLTTLVLGSMFVNSVNIGNIGKYGISLQTLAINDIEYMYPHEDLMGIFNGCPNLKEFYFNIDINDAIIRDSVLGFALTCMDLWMKIRPGLVIKRIDSDWEYTRHDVMNI